MLSPTFLFLLLWLPQFIVHWLWSDSFDPFFNDTWITTIAAVLAFVASAQLASRFRLPNRKPVAHQVPGQYATLFLLTFAVIIIVVAMQMAETAGTTDPIALREAIIAAKREGEGGFDQLIKILIAGIAFSLYFLCDAENLSRSRISGLIFLGLVAAVMTTGRLQLLLFAVAAPAILLRRGIFKTRHVVTFGALFVVLFFGIAVVLGKGGEDMDLMDKIAWNLQVYAFGSLSCFNDYIGYGFTGSAGPVMMPNFMREWLSMAPREAVNPFVQVPFYSNTYTAIFPVMHDFGQLGVLALFSALGIFHQRLYMRYRHWGSTSAVYLYALSLYPLAMTIFEDAYFSSYGIWAIFWVPLVFHWMAGRTPTFLSQQTQPI